MERHRIAGVGSRLPRLAGCITLIALGLTLDLARAEEPATTSTLSAPARPTTATTAQKPEDVGTPRASGHSAPAPQTLGHTGTQDSNESAPPKLAVTFRSQPIFYIASDGTPRSKARAARMSEALQNALNAETRADRDAPNAEATLVGTSTLALRVRGYAIGELFVLDARAAGARDLRSFGTSLEEGLGLLAADQRRKAALQGTAMRVFLAALITVVGLLLLRLVRYLFRRADEAMERQSAALKPLTLLGVPVVSAEALGAGMALLLGVGRITAVVTIILATASMVLWQFDASRGWVGAFYGWATRPLLEGVEHLIAAIPGFVLAVVLVIGMNGALRVLRLLLDSSVAGRMRWAVVSKERLRVARALASFAVIAIGAPLVVAAAFGRFHTPPETLILGASGIVALAAVPQLAAAAVGLALLWQGQLRLGDRVTIRGITGVVTRLSPWSVGLARIDGTRASIPTFALLFSEVVSDARARGPVIRVRIERTAALEQAVGAVRKAVANVGSAQVSYVGFEGNHVNLVVRAGGPEFATDAVLIALAALGPEQDVKILSASLVDVPGDGPGDGMGTPSSPSNPAR